MDATTTPAAPTHFACPLCNKSCKITKTGRVSRHGYRGKFQMGDCYTSGMVAGIPAIDAAFDLLTAQRDAQAERLAAQDAPKPGRVRRAADIVNAMNRDLVKLAQAAMLTYGADALASDTLDADEMERRARVFTNTQAVAKVQLT